MGRARSAGPAEPNPGPTYQRRPINKALVNTVPNRAYNVRRDIKDATLPPGMLCYIWFPPEVFIQLQSVSCVTTDCIVGMS